MEPNTIGSGSAEGLIAFLDYLVDKGRASKGSVAPLRSAVKQVLSTIDGDDWVKVDIQVLNVDDYMARFGNKTLGRYDVGSVETYGRRLVKAIDWYKSFLTSGPSWTPPQSSAVKLKRKMNASSGNIANSGDSIALPDAPGSSVPAEALRAPDLVSYPFPLRPDKLVNLYLPINLSKKEAQRLSAFILSLSMEEDS